MMVNVNDKEAVREWVQGLIDLGQLYLFYISQAWQNKRKDILDKDKHECQYHKRRGQYARAILVHHEKRVRKHPELALSDYYEENGEKKRQLVSLCKECHELAHPERLKKKRKKLLTPERW